MFDKMDLAKRYSQSFELRKWTEKVKNVKYPDDWKITPIPSFGGAVLRFLVNDRVSVYLDCYEQLGCMGEPYWEIYPNSAGTNERFVLGHEKEMIKSINKVLEDTTYRV